MHLAINKCDAVLTTVKLLVWKELRCLTCFHVQLCCRFKGRTLATFISRCVSKVPRQAWQRPLRLRPKQPLLAAASVHLLISLMTQQWRPLTGSEAGKQPTHAAATFRWCVVSTFRRYCARTADSSFDRVPAATVLRWLPLGNFPSTPLSIHSQQSTIKILHARTTAPMTIGLGAGKCLEVRRIFARISPNLPENFRGCSCTPCTPPPTPLPMTTVKKNAPTSSISLCLLPCDWASWSDGSFMADIPSWFSFVGGVRVSHDCLVESSYHMSAKHRHGEKYTAMCKSSPPMWRLLSDCPCGSGPTVLISMGRSIAGTPPPFLVRTDLGELCHHNTSGFQLLHVSSFQTCYLKTTGM